MGNSNKIEKSHKYNQNILDFIMDTTNCIITENHGDFEDPLLYKTYFHSNLKFYELYNMTGQGKDTSELSTPEIFIEDEEDHIYEKDMDINYLYPDSQMQFVLDL